MTDIRLPGLRARLQYLSDQMVLLDQEHYDRMASLKTEYWKRVMEIKEIENGEA